LFVAVVSGRVDGVTTTDTWSGSSDAGATRGGLLGLLIGEDGVRHYGSHLAAIAPGIASGTVVQAGQALGRVGDSGDARGVGTHVHFGISWPTQPGAELLPGSGVLRCTSLFADVVKECYVHAQ